MLVAAAAVAALAAVLALFLGTLVLVLGRLPEADEQDLLPSALVAAAVAALAFGPVRAALTAATRRTTIGGRRTPESVLEAFGDRAARDVPVEELLRQLAEALRDAYGLAAVEVWTRDGADLVRLLVAAAPRGPLTRLGAPECEALRRSGGGRRGLAAALGAGRCSRGAATRRCGSRPRGTATSCSRCCWPSGRAARSGSGPPRSAPSARSYAGSASSCTTGRWTPRCRRRSTTCGAPTTSCARPGRGWSRPPTASAGGSSATSTTARSSTWQRWRSTSAWPASCSATDRAAGRLPTVAGLLEEMQDDVRETIAQVRDLAHGIYPPLLRQAGLPDALRRGRAAQPERRHPRDRRRHRTAGGRRRGGAVLLLPRGAAEHREARARRRRHRAAAGRRRCPGARGRGRRPGLRRRQRRRRPGPAEHDRPARCGRRCAHGRHRPRSRHPGAGRGAARGAGVTAAGGGAPWGAMRVVAGAELRTRWRSLVVVGLLAGLVAAVVGASTAVARRTATAYDRLIGRDPPRRRPGPALLRRRDAGGGRVAARRRVVVAVPPGHRPGRRRPGDVPQRLVGAAAAGRPVHAGRHRGAGADRRPGRRGDGPRGAGAGGRDQRRRPHPAQAARPRWRSPSSTPASASRTARADPEGRRHRRGSPATGWATASAR